MEDDLKILKLEYHSNHSTDCDSAQLVLGIFLLSSFSPCHIYSPKRGCPRVWTFGMGSLQTLQLSYTKRTQATIVCTNEILKLQINSSCILQ